MARLSSTFNADSHTNHLQHEQLMQELRALDQALEELVCYPEVFANLASAEAVRRCRRELARNLPVHFEHEERALLDPIATLGPELAAFSQEMKRQHRNLALGLMEFREALDELEQSPDLEATVTAIKNYGQNFARELASHMGAEERKLAVLDS